MARAAQQLRLLQRAGEADRGELFGRDREAGGVLLIGCAGAEPRHRREQTALAKPAQRRARLVRLHCDCHGAESQPAQSGEHQLGETAPLEGIRRGGVFHGPGHRTPIDDMRHPLDHGNERTASEIILEVDQRVPRKPGTGTRAVAQHGRGLGSKVHRLSLG